MLPDGLKVAKIAPVHKSGYKGQLNNYCPISVLHTVARVLRKLYFNKLNILTTTFLYESLSLHFLFCEYIKIQPRNIHSSSLAFILPLLNPHIVIKAAIDSIKTSYTQELFSQFYGTDVTTIASYQKDFRNWVVTIANRYAE